MKEKARLVQGNDQVWYEIIRLAKANELSKNIYDVIYTEKEMAEDNVVDLIINVVKKNVQLTQRYSEIKLELIKISEELESSKAKSSA